MNAPRIREIPKPLDSRERLLLALIVASSILVYVRSLSGDFVFDDMTGIVTNPAIGTWEYVRRAFTNDVWWFRDPRYLPQSLYYRPVMQLWLAANYHLFGLHPIGWHVAKIALHAVAVALCFGVARLILLDNPAALVAAMLFALMPSHAEAIAWISALPQLLATVFELAAMWCFIERRRRPIAGWCGALALYALAQLSFEGAILFPLAIASYVFLIERPREATGGEPTLERTVSSTARSLSPAIAFGAVAAAFLAVRASVIGVAGMIPQRLIPAGWKMPAETRHGATVLQVVQFHHSAGDAIRTAPSVLLKYIVLMITPWAAAPTHRVQWITSAGDPAFYAPLALIVAIAMVVFAMLRGDARRDIYFFCSAWIALGLAPAMNLGNIVSPIQDRYLYLPSFGLCVAAGDVIVRLARGVVGRRTVVVAVAATAIVSIVALWNVQKYWRDDFAYFSRCAAITRDDPYYKHALGLVLIRRGDLAGAEVQLKESVKLAPDEPSLHLALANLETKLGHRDEATEQYSQYLDSFPDAPWLKALQGGGSDSGKSGPAQR